jgi:hypothetical protein
MAANKELVPKTTLILMFLHELTLMGEFLRNGRRFILEERHRQAVPMA